jgi:hypothetical protein
MAFSHDQGILIARRAWVKRLMAARWAEAYRPITPDSNG